MKDDASVSFSPADVGNISLERDVAKFTWISITLSNEKENIFMNRRLMLGDWDGNSGLETMNGSHSAQS